MRVLGELNERLLDPDDIVVSASGSLPGDMQRLWRPRSRGSYHMEYGFSCMGYEVNGALGAKLAAPGRAVYAIVGDGAFVMLHSELLTAIREQIKITVLLFDNGGYQVIDNLQTSQGISSYGNKWKMRGSGGKLDGPPPKIDYATVARGYGMVAFTVRSLAELHEAWEAQRAAPGPVLLDIKVTEKSMTHGYESWWRVGTPAVSSNPAVHKAYQDQQRNIKQAQKF